jgi:NAD(P)-dependent dehydrogenase (short-subunit alcohol dehydrogenase family)
MQNKVVVITGASQGIGEQIAYAFSRVKNVTLVLLARSEKNLQKVVKACKESSVDVHYHVCDVTDEAAVQSAASEILSQWGAPDVLVNNAGQYAPTSFINTSLDEFKSVIDVNLTSAFLVTRAFLADMLKKKSGDIFFICSIASLHGYADSFAYCAAKHGMLGLARTLRQETLNTGLRVMSIMPGAVLTPAWGNEPHDEKRFIPAADVGKIIVDLHHLDASSNVEELVIRPRLGDIK